MSILKFCKTEFNNSILTNAIDHIKYDAYKFFSELSDFDYYYDSELKKQVKKNVLRLIESAKNLKSNNLTPDAKKLRDKIKSAALRNPFIKIDEIDTCNSIISQNPYALLQFMVQPKKQNGGEFGNEKIQQEYIKKVHNILIEKLPSSGKKSYRVSDGILKIGTDKSTETTKSLDFKVVEYNGSKLENLNIYIVGKITQDSTNLNSIGGGAQNNQEKDAYDIISKIDFSKPENSNLKIILLLDGGYYKGKNKLVLEIIQKLEGNKNIFITTSDGIKTVIGSILHN